MKNKRGIIKIDHGFFRELENHKEHLSMLFANFIPIRIENNYDDYIYHGYSDSFRELTEAEMVPSYEAVFTYSEESDSFTLSFKEIK